MLKTTLGITKNKIMNCVIGLPIKFFLFFTIGILLTMVSNPCYAQATGVKPFVVVIDAGHGGKDPGTVGKKSYEKNINLDVAKKLGFYLSNLMPDVKVIYTRTEDVFIELSERANIANRNHADLFVSIHSNAVTDKSAYGSETWVMGLDKSNANFDLVIKENKVIMLEDDYETTYEGFDPTDPASYIMFQVLQSTNLNLSITLAETIQDQFRNRAQRKDRGVFQGPLVVLYRTTMPGVLVELGFLSNQREEDFLITDNGKDIMASAIFRAIKSYREAVLHQQTELTGQASPKTEAPVRVQIDEPVKTNPTINNQAEFRIQLVASKASIPLNSKTFKGYRNIEEVQLDGLYKYMTKPVTDYQEALKIKEEMGKSFKGAFIVPFKNGQRTTLEEALKSP